ncbi:hypothetical protein HOD88_02055 [archaeon]|jgi:hypothetical protein|nr:hypothetical protein [archaeon]
MQKIKNEKELLGILKRDIKESNKKRIVFLAGHFPLIYEESGAIEAIKKWGAFSIYSLEVAAKLAIDTKNLGKEIKFVFFVDDHIYEGYVKMNSWQLSKRRNSLYKLRSGKNAKLPKKYKEILEKNGFSEKEVIRQNQNKVGREDCLFFSEKILRKSLRKIENACAREYTEFIEDKTYFRKEKDYIVTIAPNMCKENICDVALDKEIRGLSSSNIFMETINPSITKKELFTFGRGVTYRKD